MMKFNKLNVVVLVGFVGYLLLMIVVIFVMVEEVVEENVEKIVVVGVCGVFCFVISLLVLVDVLIVDDINGVVLFDMNDIMMMLVFFYILSC